MARLFMLGLLGLLALTSPAAAAELEFQSEQASRAAFQDFALNFDNPATPIPGHGKLTPQTVTQVPFLATLPQRGVSQALVTLNACAINQPHVHPRGTEVAYITKGQLTFGFMEENGGRQNITFFAEAGQSFVFPQGLMHYAMNLNCEPAAFIATFPDLDAGTQTIASNFFAFPDYVLKATLNGLDDDTLNKVIAAAKNTANPSADQACLARCNAGKTTPMTPTPVSNMPTDSHMGTYPTESVHSYGPSSATAGWGKRLF